VKAYPKALLQKPEVYWPDPPFSRVRHVYWQDKIKTPRDVTNGTGQETGKTTTTSSSSRRTVDMAFAGVINRKIHKSAVIRNKISVKLKTATSLVVTRGADAIKSVNKAHGMQMKLVFRQDEQRDWILPGMIYSVHNARQCQSADF
jgi:hypothetical protein